MPRKIIREARWQLIDALTDIRLAEGIGIDAFQYNIYDASDKGECWRYFLSFLNACALADTTFQIMPCIDCASLKGTDILNILQLLSGKVHEKGFYRDNDQSPVIAIFLPENMEKDLWLKCVNSA